MMDSATPPEGVLDVLIVGAGPAGTAAAFRAAELGLSVLVIDQDEVLAVLRDWISPDGDESKDKRVDSSYGPGGKRVPFPQGGDLCGELVFGDQVPASQIYNRWTDIYRRNEIASRSGWELIGLQRDAEGAFEARCRQASGEETVVRARNLTLALGRGSPHKLECPGDKEGISYKLMGVDKYVGSPACVIGGGTSAAEAVIAVSNAKAQADDPTDVYWAYRKRRLPKVNVTLAESFFAAYAGNGNITYLPYSFPLAVLPQQEDSPVLALRSDRVETRNRPATGTYFEFPVTQVLACIGAEVPARFLTRLTRDLDGDDSLKSDEPQQDRRGIRRLTSADDDEEYMAVSPLLESKIPNIFLVGDLLSPCYLLATEFHPDAVQSTVIDHTGNFKQGMTDGVLAIETIRMRLDGKSDDEIQSLLESKKSEWKEAHAATLKDKKQEAPKREAPPEPKPEPPKPVQIGARFARLDHLMDQVIGQDFFLPGQVVIGRSSGNLTFPNDENLVDDHAAIQIDTEACYVTTDGFNGECLVGIAAERTIETGDVIMAGAKTMRIDAGEAGPALAILQPDGKVAATFPITKDGGVFGRTTIDRDDKSMSRRHFYLQSAGNIVKLRDFGSTNGTYVMVRGALRLNDGDEVAIGKQRFRFLGMSDGSAEEATPVAAAAAAPAAPAAPPPAAAEKPSAAAAPAPEPAATAAPAARAPAPAAPVSGEPGVTVGGKALAMSEGQTILDKLIAENMATDKPASIGGDVQLLYECKKGTCGKCIVTVESGMESLSALSGKEKRTLKLIVPELEDMGLEVDAATCHLACRATATGPAQIQLLGNTETD